MSLQVWLPLNNHINNQGLNTIRFKSSNVSYTQGKLGYCASGTIQGTAAELNSTDGFCCSFWWNIANGDSYNIKFPITNTGIDDIFNMAKMDYTSNYAIKLHCNNNKPQMIWIYDTRSTSGVWELGTWNHYVINVNNGDFGVQVKVFVNGALKHQYNSADYNFTLRPGTISISGTAKMNDFRLYDHPLCLKEIDELSRGLMLHYPLRDSTLQSTTNYLLYPTPGSRVSAGWDSSLHPNAINVSGFTAGYNSGVDSPTIGYHAYWNVIDDVPTMVFPNLNSAYNYKGRWLGISSWGTVNLAQAIGKGNKYTISFEAKSDIKGKTVQFGLYYRKNGATSNNFHDGQHQQSLTTTWKKYSYTWTLGQDGDSSNVGAVYMYGHYGIEGTAYVRNIQLEINDHATDYVSGSREASKVYDCSGFGHHGRVVGAVSMMPDSSRNKYSAYITDGRSNYIASDTMIFPKDSITMSCWVKGSNAGYSNYHIPLSFGSANYEFSLEGTTGKFRAGYVISGTRQCVTTNGTTIDGKWHMITSTFDGTTIRRYVDGIPLTSTAAAGTLSGGTGNLLVGNYNGTTYGNSKLYTSDVRIYATALDELQIKELYLNGATVDNGGNVYAYEFTEEGDNSVFKEGVVDFENFIEYNINKIMRYDGDLWVQILHHNNRAGTKYFTPSNAANHTEEDLYSRLYLTEQLRGADGAFEFLVLQPDDDAGTVYRWIQTNNPNNTTSVTGFKNISNMSGGLVKCSGNTHWAISTSTGNWWNAVGCWTAYNGGIPGFGKKTIKGSLDVYVKLDKRTSFLIDSIETQNYYEF